MGIKLMTWELLVPYYPNGEAVALKNKQGCVFFCESTPWRSENPKKTALNMDQTHHTWSKLITGSVDLFLKSLLNAGRLCKRSDGEFQSKDVQNT